MANRTGHFRGGCPICRCGVEMHLVKHEPRPPFKVWRGTCLTGHKLELKVSTVAGEDSDEQELEGIASGAQL